MHMDFDSPKVRAHQEFNISNSVFCVPADAPGHATLSPHLKRSQEDAVVFFDSWSPVAVWICTRKRDGAAAEVCRFNGLDDEDGINSFGSEPYSNISFNYKELNLPRDMEGLSHLGWKFMQYFDEVHSSATLAFDESTGHLRYIFTGFLDRDTNYVPDSVLRMLLHGLCDEAVRG
jgi:hypothetical protein